VMPYMTMIIEYEDECVMRSETTTTTTSLPASGVGWGGGDVLDAANLHAGTGESAESGLSTRTGSLGAIACGIRVSNTPP
jgi:hypothetical protein